METGLLTAEKFANVMNREWARMRRQELPLSLMLVSIDRFEDFQPRHSRLAYEAALRKLSDVLRNAGKRPGDVAARLGPGAFALLFPETDHNHVNRLADAVRARIRQLGVLANPAEAGKPLTATVHHADGSEESFEVRQTMNDEQIEWFKAGSALNVLKNK